MALPEAEIGRLDARAVAQDPQPVIITATSGNALTIDTIGNVTITGSIYMGVGRLKRSPN